jgi:YidC/Oxa1 family membrane protein insertase
MMDSVRFVIAIIMMVAVIVVTNLLFPPVPAPEQTAADSARVSQPRTTPAPPLEPTDRPAPPPVPAPVVQAPGAAAAPASPARTVYIRSPLYRYGFSTRGGGLTWAEILHYKSFTREGPVQLVAARLGPLVSYRMRLGPDTVIDLSQLPFEASPAGGLDLDDKEQGNLRLNYTDPVSGFGIELSYTFDAASYLLTVSGRVTGVETTRAEVLIDLGPTLAVNEAQPAEDLRSLSYVVNSPNTGIRTEPLSGVEAQRIEEGPFSWVALKNKYFLLAALAPEGRAEPFGGLIATPSRAAHAAGLTATLPVGRDAAFDYQLFIGPQEPSRLAQVGRDLQDVNPYGWRVFQPLVKPLARAITWTVLQMHNLLGLSYGWVLILFGILVRVVLWPLNSKAMRAQLKNMEVQPMLKEIQDKYRKDPERLQKEMVRLYKEEGFNPLGGCLPMMIPMPVLITLYFVFQGTIEFRGVPFLWLPDLSRADPYYILPILMGVSMFVLQWVSMQSMPPNPQMKMMLWFMPIFMTAIFLSLASGLNLYYTSSNIASIPQQLMIMRERKRWQAGREAKT